MHNKSLGIKDDDLQSIINVLSRTPLVESAKVYGSRAKGTYKPGSDIDLTLIGGDLNWQELQVIECQLDDLLLPYQFDVSLYNSLDNVELIDHIDRVGKVIYAK
jgi:predicted nucleotidyltransferase